VPSLLKLFEVKKKGGISHRKAKDNLFFLVSHSARKKQVQISEGKKLVEVRVVNGELSTSTVRSNVKAYRGNRYLFSGPV